MADSFASQAKDVFSFLEDDGFCVTHSQTSLRYENATVFVDVSWDPRDWELNISFGLQPLKGEVATAFSLSDLLLMQCDEDPQRMAPPQVAETRLRPFLEKLAEDVRAYAQPALDGDRMFFQRLDAFRNKRSSEYMREMEMRRLRSKAEGAWRIRHYGQVASLYGSVEEFLTESEKAKLNYARKHQRN